MALVGCVTLLLKTPFFETLTEMRTQMNYSCKSGSFARKIWSGGKLLMHFAVSNHSGQTAREM